MDLNPNHWQQLRSGSDIRCDAARLTDEFTSKLGYAFAQWVARRLGVNSDKIKLAVGHDSRRSGPRLKNALISGMRAADSDVLDCRLCTTPAMFMTCVEPSTRASGAIMVTASNLPADKNGFKFITRDGGLSGDDVAELIDVAAHTELPDPLVTEIDLLSTYTDALAATVRKRLNDASRKPLLGLHVVVDAGNGAGGFYARFLEELGADVDGSRRLEPDGNLLRPCPGMEGDATAELSRAVVENGADLGVLFDADCDRAAIVDQSGRAIGGNRLIALIAAILLEENPGVTFVTDSVTSSGLNQFINEWGGVHYRFKRGYRNVIDEAIRLNADGIDCPLAIETSGHAAFRENHFLDDGMYLVTRLICEALRRKREGQTLSSLIDELQEPVERAEIRLPILESGDFRAAGQEVIEAILSHTLTNPAWQLAPDNREGVRISFNLDGGVNNAWFLLRLSVHDPVMPLNAESDVPGGVKRMLRALCELLDGTEILDLDPLRAAIDG